VCLPAGRIASRPDEHAPLERVAGGLQDNLAPVRVPAEERSAELFDDEKALDRYRKTGLFTSGALPGPAGLQRPAASVHLQAWALHVTGWTTPPSSRSSGR
jgi:hypothetical protein